MGIRKKPVLGCVADDFTGAGDVASFLEANGATCLLVNGIPEFHLCKDDDIYDVIVIALKSRSVPADEAVEETKKAMEWLRENGAQKLFFKYCSTFDSTPAGNIGPVLDFLLERYQLPYTILCPALPVNNRIVRDGKLFVNGVPLDESPMRNHPLNPMWDSDLTVLMGSQSRYPSFKLDSDMMKLTDGQILEQIQVWKQENRHFYIVPDFCNVSHGQRIARIFGELLLLSGGSGIVEYLFRKMVRPNMEFEEKGALILSGSCSEMTIRQINHFIDSGNPALRIDPDKLQSGEQTIDSVWQFMEAHYEENILLYSSLPENVRNSRYGKGQKEISKMLETAMAELGRRALDSGWKKLVVAGGETSGAVAKALGIGAYHIGISVSPGVPVLIPKDRKQVRLVLKSGNFGQENFFTAAIETMLRTERESYESDGTGNMGGACAF